MVEHVDCKIHYNDKSSIEIHRFLVLWNGRLLSTWYNDINTMIYGAICDQSLFSPVWHGTIIVDILYSFICFVVESLFCSCIRWESWSYFWWIADYQTLTWSTLKVFIQFNKLTKSCKIFANLLQYITNEGMLWCIQTTSVCYFCCRPSGLSQPPLPSSFLFKDINHK